MSLEHIPGRPEKDSPWLSRDEARALRLPELAALLYPVGEILGRSPHVLELPVAPTCDAYTVGWSIPQYDDRPQTVCVEEHFDIKGYQHFRIVGDPLTFRSLMLGGSADA